MDGLHFIYFADPMCSWCWGFSPVIQALRRRYADILPMRVVMGGLRPGTTERLDDKARARMRGYWGEIGQLSGQPFSDSILEDEDLVYDTDPPARAVVLARRTSGEAALDYLASVQSAFYAGGRNVTRNEVLADIASEAGFDRASFLSALGEEALKTETWRDYAISQRAGVTGFPTLIVGPNSDGTYAPVSRGYQDGSVVLASVDGWLGGVRPAAE